MSQVDLSYLASQTADWVLESGEEVEKQIRIVDPPEKVVQKMLEHGRWEGIPELKGVVDVPILTEAGALCTPGFDERSGYYFSPNQKLGPLNIRLNPTPAEVAEARVTIQDELLVDFPFADDASRANAVALLLLPFVRALIDGPTPLHLIDAPAEGTGKSLLAVTIGTVAFGGGMESSQGCEKNDDWKKTIMSTLIESPRYIFLDNVSVLDSAALSSATTSPVFKDRILGLTKVVSAPVRCVWLATGNNVKLSSEIGRRTVYIRLNAHQEDAYRGRTFKHKLPSWADENRALIVGACLTLCNAWVAAGRPAGETVLGSYEEWSAVIGGILKVAGIPGLLENRAELKKANSTDRDEWIPFVMKWWDEFGDRKVKTNDLYGMAKRHSLLDRVFSDAKAKNEAGERTSLGMALRSVRERVIAGLQIQREENESRTGLAQYRLEEASGTALSRVIRQTELSQVAEHTVTEAACEVIRLDDNTLEI